MMHATDSNKETFDLSKKRPHIEDQRRSEDEDMNSARDGSHSPSPTKRLNDRDPEEANSPEMMQAPRNDMPNKSAKTMAFSSSMDTDSPASYPKHVIVPSPPDSNEQRRHNLGPRPSGHYMDGSPSRNKPENVVTPLRNENRQLDHRGYDGPSYRPPEHGGYNHSGGDRYGYNMAHGREMDHGHGYGGGGNRFPIQPQPKRWACDYCCVATFTSFDEAQAHEEACAARYGVVHRQRPYPAYGGPPPFPTGSPQQQPQQREGGLGTLYQATQELRTFGGGHSGGHRMPPQHHQNHEPYHHSPHGPPPPYGPPPPQHQQYPQGGGWGGGYDPSMNQERNRYPQLPPRFQEYNMYNNGGHNGNRNVYMSNQKRMLLAMPTDADSLSDRQCYVRSDFVEVFEASDKDVSARHSKGAQKLMLGQVGIRCIHCSHLRPKDRAERAVCYPSSISRIYQTVADMQRFHFEQCREIPDNTLKVYRSLKTTRPRGVGSPQTYWIQSAKLMALVDSEEGIRFETEEEKLQAAEQS